MSRTFSVLAALTLVAATVHAQDSTPPDTRGMDRVVVTSASDAGPIEGYLLRLGPESLTLKTTESSIDVPLSEVLRIDARKDSVRNGAIIGAAILGGLCVISCGMSLEGGFLVWAVSINSVLGAAIGAGIDASIDGRTPIYKRAAAAGLQSRQGITLSKRLRF